MKKAFTFFFLISTCILIAQLESSHWYFGRNAGIDFTSGNPVPDYNGQLDTREGCASISDANGNLLFYTDGSTVYNANHNIMQNGTGLLGNTSSSQSAIIIPYPQDPNKYYIFTVDSEDNFDLSYGPNDGLNFYIVDMSLANGLGAVLSFDNVSNNILPLCSEKIAAVLHPNNTDYWIITHFEDSFYAYQITANGILAPVVTQIGYNLPYEGYPVTSRGYLKASPNGQRIAIAHLSYIQQSFSGAFPANTIKDNAAPGVLAVYDFNAQTGIVSNEIILNQENGILNGSPYGIEFSPNSELLYAELDFNDTSSSYWDGAEISQFNLSASPTTKTILADSQTFYNNGTNTIFKARGALQLALDGKIYFAITRDNYTGIGLSVIENPNQIGLSAGYQHESFIINTINNPNATVAYGLPPFISSYFIMIIEVDNTNICDGNPIDFSLSTYDNLQSIIWDFDDGTTSSENQPSHLFNELGTYTVTATITTDTGDIYTRQIVITVLPIPETVNVTLTECDANGDGITTFNLSEADDQVVNNSNNYSISYHLTIEDAEVNQNALQNIYTNQIENQIVYARVDNGQCYNTAEVLLETTLDVNRSIPGLNICDENYDNLGTFDLNSQIPIIEALFTPESVNIMSFHTSLADAANNQNAINSTFNTTQENAQTIYARVEAGTDCIGIINFELTVTPQPQPTLIDYEICEDNDSVTLEIEDIYTSYEWSGLSNEDLNQPLDRSYITVTQPGNYTVTVTDTDGCVGWATSTVSVIPSPIIQFVEVRNGSSIIIHATGSYSLEYSLDGNIWTDDNIIHDLAPQIYQVWVRYKETGCLSKPYIFGIIDIPNIITPNNDGYNDNWRITGLNAYPGAVVYVYDRFGKQLIEYTVPEYQIPMNANFQYYPIERTVIWDGYYLGRNVPSTSYWYIIDVPNGQRFSGWVTVKNY